MSLYSRFVLPTLVDLACGAKRTMRQREKVIPLAQGRVLEVGFGSGLNLRYYRPERVTRLWGLEPCPQMRKRAERAARSGPIGVELLGLPGDEIPLERGCVDTVVTTYTLCTIPEIRPALEEMIRVLAPGGRLLFCEHGRAPDPGVRRWQDRLNPIWERVGGGCQLNRPIPQLIEEGGFRIRDMQASYIGGWRPASFNYWGVATAT
jgi:ubiquinone/menaquinone biosynthesis C-methylase UbiE